jgi:hypothetical protein
MPYEHCLEPKLYDGDINGIRVYWREASIPTLANRATALQVPLETLKALTEHFGYLSALRMGNTTVKIL